MEDVQRRKLIQESVKLFNILSENVLICIIINVLFLGKPTSGEHAALLTGHLVATFDIIFQNSRALWHHTCHLQTEILHLRQWAVRYFPHTALAWLAKDYGTIQ